MTIMELVLSVKEHFTGEPVKQPQRRAMRIQDMDEELVLALAAANVDHLDSEARPAR